MASTSLGSLFVDLLMKTGRFETDAGRAAKIAERRSKEIERAFRGAFSTIGAGLAGFAAGLLSVNAVFSGLKGAIDAADKLNDFNQRLGISAEVLSGWGYAAKQSGTDIDTLGKGLNRLSKNLADALDPKSGSAKLFADLGVSVTDAAGNLRSLEDVVPDIANAFKTLNNETLEAALAQELFGKSGVELLEFLNQGSNGLDTLRGRARELGIQLSQETLTAADAFNDTLGDVRAAAEGLYTQIAAALLPQLTEAAAKFVEVATDGDRVKATVDSVVVAFDGFVSISGSVVSAGESIRSILSGVQTDADSSAESFRQLVQSARGLAAIPASMAAYAELQFTEAGSPERIAARRRFNDARNELIAGWNGTPVQQAPDLPPLPAGLLDGVDLLGGTSQRFSAVPWTAAPLGGMQGASPRSSAPRTGGSGLGARSRAARSDPMADVIDFGAKLAESQAKMKAALDETAKASNEAIGSWARLQAQLDGPLAEAELEHIERMLEIDELGRKAGASAEAIVAAKGKEAAAYAKVTAAIEEQAAAAANPQVVALMDDFRRGAADAFTDIVIGSASAQDALKSFFDDLAAQVTRTIANRWIQQLFGPYGTTGAGTMGGDALGGILSSVFGGGRANGGSVLGGRMYEVNERGVPELLSVRNRQMLLMPPNVSGMVSPMRGAAAGRQFEQTVNIQVEGRVDRETRHQIALRVGQETRLAMARSR